MLNGAAPFIIYLLSKTYSITRSYLSNLRTFTAKMKECEEIFRFKDFSTKF